MVLKVGAGKPVAVKVCVGALEPVTKTGIGPVLMMTGASFIVRVKLWSVKPVVFVARTVKVWVPPVLATPVPLSKPCAVRVMPLGRLPACKV